MKSQQKVSSVIALLLSLSMAASAQFGSNANRNTLTSSLSIKVITANNQPVANARIEVRDMMTGRIVQSGYTTGSGQATLDGLENGNYEVVATSGTTEARERLSASMGGNIITLTLPNAMESNVGGTDMVSVAQFKVPGKARKEYEKAEKALSKRKLDEANKRIAKALDIYPNFAEALTLRAILAMDSKQVEPAIADLQKAIESDPSYATAYFAMGAVLSLQSKFDDALRSLDRGLALQPNSWQGHFEVGKAQIGKGNYAAAIKSLDKAQMLTPTPYNVIHLAKAHAFLALKNYPDAMGELQVYLEKAPQEPHAANARKMLDQVKAYAANTQ